MIVSTSAAVTRPCAMRSSRSWKSVSRQTVPPGRPPRQIADDVREGSQVIDLQAVDDVDVGFQPAKLKREIVPDKSGTPEQCDAFA